MSLKKLIEEITKPLIDEMGIVAGDGTIKGGSKLSKIKKMKKKGHTSVPYGSGYKKVSEIAVRQKPKKFRDIYDALPIDLKKRVMNLKNFDQRRDAHPEGNVLKHTIAVTNRALKTGDIDFALSALFHDIGKDSTAKLHPKKGFWTHYGHEHVSAKLVKKYRTWIKSMGGNPTDIYYIVKQHMRMKVFDKMKWVKQEKMKKFRAFDKLKKFSKDFDKGGRGINEKKLRVFDFDDTLVKSNSKVYVTNSGKRKTLTPGEFAIYKQKPGDDFDFSDFDKVIEPKEIKAMFRVFKNVYKASGSRRLTILTARAAYKPVRKFLKDVGYSNVYVVALGDSNPKKKADWIKGQIERGYDDILFLDDSPKNVSAVKKIKQKYPNIKMDARVVNYS